MKEISSRLVSAIPGKTRIQLIWECENSWFARLMMGLPKTARFKGVYCRDGKYWYAIDGDKLGKGLQDMLTQIEARLLASS